MAKQKEAWDKLSMREKAQLIKLSVGSGISDIKTIRDTYNLYSNGGNLAHKYDGTTEDSQFVAVDAKVPKWGAYAPNGPHWGLEGVSGMNGKRYLHYREKQNFYVNEDGTVRAYGYESLPIVNRYGTDYIEIPATGKDSTSTWRTNSWGDTHTVQNFHRIPVGKTAQYTPPPPPPIPQDTTITVVPPPVPIDTIIPTPAPPPTSIDTVIPKPKPEPKPKPKPKTEPKPEPEPWPSIEVTGLEKDNTNVYTREATQPIYMEGSAPVQNNQQVFDNVEDFMSYYGLANGGNLSHKKSTGGPIYPFSFEKNPFLKTPVVRYDEGGEMVNINLPEVTVFPEETYITYTGNESKSFIPTKKQYNEFRANEIRRQALVNMNNRNTPYVPYINDDPTKPGSSCLYTFLSNYPVPLEKSNRVFWELSPEESGFKRVDTPLPGDGIQVFSSPKPHRWGSYFWPATHYVSRQKHGYKFPSHMTMFKDIDTSGVLIRGSNGSTNPFDTSAIIDERRPISYISPENVDIYRFIGTQQQQKAWEKEYNNIYKHGNN